MKKVLIILALIALGILAYSLTRGGEPAISHTNSVDKRLTIYSDKTITPNARVTNPEFSHLAFAEPEGDFVRDHLAAPVRLMKYLAKFLGPHEEKEYGTWLWTPTMQITPEYTKQILDQAERDGVNTIYLSIDSYLDIFVMRNGVAKTAREKEFSRVLSTFIAEANKRGVAVDAEAGWRNWAEPGNEYKALAVLGYVKKFNQEHEAKFRGFQYDIEPYMLDKYETESARILQNFITLIDKTEEYIGSDSLALSVVVPAFYDERDKSTPVFEYRGARESVFKHLLNILDRRSGSSIIVMSYRNFAKGNDGSIEISQNEFRTAKKGFYNTSVIVAQETGDFLPKYITFHGKSKKYFEVETDILSRAFSRNRNFGGLAIHYANSMAELK